MKKMLGSTVALWVLVGLLAGCAKSDEDMQPATEEKALQALVQGVWRIERVNNRLCRGSNCTMVVYNGTPEDYFEFRADSAFLQRTSMQYGNSLYRDQFKVRYTQYNELMLSNFGWSAKVRVMQLGEGNMVLESTYLGADPSAVFTDTYFLQR